MNEIESEYDWSLQEHVLNRKQEISIGYVIDRKGCQFNLAYSKHFAVA